ncbi:MAG: prepilin-type N-terminal cleavage/methylation domain-containing protein [Candidatus Zixiibacteriota bacterium]|nr:MAG: prepilin-type N-terminal cleavage/methylation domain-containing protein [candidate division Zixibacteria bacterium]
MNRMRNISGFTLIELAIVIVIIGVIAAIATQKLSSSVETARVEQTKQEMEQLAYSITGNPNVYSKGTRTDFGYVGDVGALPDSLGALAVNPGGYATWNGPYMGSGLNEDDFKNDAWGVEYEYEDTVIRSTGSGSNIEKVFAISTASLTSNTVKGYVVDANHDVPGASEYTDMILRLTYPNATGSTTSSSINPDAYGNFSFAGIPIGCHTLDVIYSPEADTVSYNVTVEPSRTVKLSITFPADLW